MNSQCYIFGVMALCRGIAYPEGQSHLVQDNRAVRYSLVIRDWLSPWKSTLFSFGRLKTLTLTECRIIWSPRKQWVAIFFFSTYMATSSEDLGSNIQHEKSKSICGNFCATKYFNDQTIETSCRKRRLFYMAIHKHLYVRLSLR